MKFILQISILLLFLSGYSQEKEQLDKQAVQFTAELLELKEFFQIPGLAVSIEKEGTVVYQNYLGLADLEKSIPVNSKTLFPIASITKVFSGVLIMKLVEQEKLSLNDAINNYLPTPIVADSILVKHVLSHTSQGNVGEAFYYSSRFGLLTKVIEKAANKSFSQVLQDEILTPLELTNTFLLKDSTQIAGMARPYVLNNGIENGFIEYGFSTSAGIVSNISDLARFNKALDNNTLISGNSKTLMFSSFKNTLPYGFGIFNQTFEGLNMVWAYGQYDFYSGLFLKIPSKGLTLTILANNNLLSDPPRLIYGDAMSSLFVLSFLKNYVFNYKHLKLLENGKISNQKNIESPQFFRKKLLAQALSTSFMARINPKNLPLSIKLLKIVFTAYPDYLEYADLNLLHTLTFIKEAVFFSGLGDFNDFDIQIENIGEKLLQNEPNNPYANVYLGSYYARKGINEKARFYFERIVNARNFDTNWYTREARNWLNQNN